ncbi:fungal-specific transcription factor domain-containing protein [Fusarium sp. MPI-SDFR-AT-0072]|uniref:Nitrogen assimilation transcription factor nit-4 n=1 Tax=Fusarium oxysporum f. sp. rapae TaxID=485398 RepID=A0A8J5P9D6_FUSOX|nr:Nitrogen assimilation transcription factor nit-4 [Fusarium oxysporum f. sp. rapae]KAH7180544.1 fungal-specific transcription factor domain-containing protein [Fusarium sp. MPI-SDFR-AT-0072]
MSSVKATKKSAFSCEPCRRRKVKCGGEQPICNRCAARSDDCIYKLNPTLSYTQRLEERIKELEDQLAAIKSPPSVAASNHSSPGVWNGHDLNRHPDEHAMTRSFMGLKIDDKGGITYHGPTSLFNLPSDPHKHKPDSISSIDSDAHRRERLVNNAWHQRAMENLSDIPEPFQYLLNVHWCWIQPLFNFIYRPAFTRDMQSMGPYYSHTLLNAMLSHSIRWGKSDPSTKQLLDQSYDGGAVFAKHARSMLFDELSRGVCTIPTVQTLLLLSAGECGHGNTTQAWIYSGIAFRLIDHLGICVDGQRYPGSVHLTDEEVEIRHRLYWSCYFWDKIISLYLGRSPSLQHTQVSPPQIIMDDSAENELWVPFDSPHGSDWKYPPATAHSTSCFMSACRLSVIFNEILIHMYDPLLENTEAEMQECLQTQDPAMRLWWEQLPPHLKIELSAMPELAPPSHIVTMNALYHTFRILLFRPMLTWQVYPEDEGPHPMQNHLVECVTSATSIIAIFDLFCRTFTISHCVLSLSYSVYIAATIFLLQVQATPEDQQAVRKLSFCVRALHQAKTVNPVISSALDLITREMANLGLDPGFSTPQQQPPPPMPQPMPDVPMPTDIPITETVYPASFEIPAQQSPYEPEQLFQTPWADNMNPNAMAVDRGVFEALSSFEPLSVRVGAIYESGNNPQNFG